MRCALTYDDGPSQWTPAILDLLTAPDAKATFFVVGERVMDDWNLTRRIVSEGHLLGNHTETHRRLTQLTDAEVTEEIAEGSMDIRRATGIVPEFWRAPYFDRDGRIDRLAASWNLTHVGCSIDPMDWAEPDADTIAERVLDWLHDGAIIDLHDGIPPGGGNGTSSRQPTVDATRLILENACDVEWVTVADL